ncbi:MAG: response regulator [Deltaproteobacteria bacterium]|nr:response regulator [Deltaproteobacteria bacterium]
MKKRVLLVEDHPGTIELLQQELDILGYEVKVAQNGIEAVEMAVSDPPEIIIMDILLPKMDGLQAISEIRKNPATSNVPILAATALARPGDREKCLAGGCDAYISKPFTHRQLAAAIEKLFSPQAE